MANKTLKLLGFIAGLIAAVWLFSSVSAENSTISYWVITVRGSYMDVWVDCNDDRIIIEHIDGATHPRGWVKHSVEVDLSGCSLLRIGFTSEFPANSLGWKIKGIAIDGNIISNGCFEYDLLGWVLPDDGWSLSVEGGTKNLIPDCEGGYAAKHGPISANGAGIANIPATIYKTIIPGIKPEPTATIEPTIAPTTEPTNTPDPTATITIYLPLILEPGMYELQCNGQLTVIDFYVICE